MTDEPGGSGEDDERFRRFAATRDRALRNELVEQHLGLAHHFAARYRRSGVEDDDLHQVAFLGLVKAVDRFDPDRGVAFSTFAGRTIDGELKRHFRDRTWSLRVPRSVKDLHVAVRRASEELQQQLARSPTVRELADYLGVSHDEVLGAIAAVSARRTGSLDRPDDDLASDRVAGIGRPGGTAAIEDRDAVERLLATLAPREREIVRLRFFEQLSQDQIAERVGLSQMHVSRLLRQSFARMRSTTLEE
ncbi:MAG: SigB/SigF/SigG family RNA polymerase sigma factor [Actinobacteria bacterium]|nr:SigB/SigF/SigG family RNA polymerase sigma factor [Actinomycetota bacterium]